MKEKLLGSKSEQSFIRGYLELLRSLKPVEMFLLPNAMSLSELRENKSGLDFELFDIIMESSINILTSEYSEHFETIPEGRYYLIKPHRDDIGGFHSKNSVGYHDLFCSACSVVLNSELYKDRIVRTIEFARNYLHDSIHHSTFRSFRLIRQSPRTKSHTKNILPNIYREQHGINFRNADGKTYSTPMATIHVPHTINLGILMDGIGTIISAEVLNRINVQKVVKSKSEESYAMVNEILLHTTRSKPTNWGENFFLDVVLPTSRFIEYWGGDVFSKLILQAMFDGQMIELKKYFATKYGSSNAWEEVFLSPDFNHSTNF